MSINNVFLSGRLTADPELKQTSSGLDTTTFCVAVDNYSAKTKKSNTTFVNVTAWTAIAKYVCENGSKGAGVVVTAYLKTSEYTTTEGKKVSRLELVATSVEFLTRRNSKEATENSVAVPESTVEETTDSFPF